MLRYSPFQIETATFCSIKVSFLEENKHEVLQKQYKRKASSARILRFYITPFGRLRKRIWEFYKIQPSALVNEREG